jgi:hypothetical protein
MMPSLFKYFTNVGAVLLGLLMLANSVLEPESPKSRVAEAAPKVIVRHDPRASLAERLRVEDAAQKAAAKGEMLARPDTASGPVVPITQRAEPVAPAQAEAVQVSALSTVATAIPTEETTAPTVHKKIKAERLRKQRLARQRARALERTASRQQEQQHYGYAPPPTYGPFAGWGQPHRW